MSTHLDPIREDSSPKDADFMSSSDHLQEAPAALPFQDNREETKQLKAMQTAANNSPQVKQLKTLQAAANESLFGDAPVQRQTAPKVEQNDNPMQLQRLSPAQATAQADAARTADPNNRGAMTNDWIQDTDQAATTGRWTGMSTSATRYLASGSLSGGGQERPPSIDLKAKVPGAKESDFIFHLPVFTGIQELIQYALTYSGVEPNVNRIQKLATLDLSRTTDPELRLIEQQQQVDISRLTNHPVYAANRADVLAFDAQFENNLKNQKVDPANATLAGIKADPTYQARLGNMKARAAKVKFDRQFTAVARYIPAAITKFDPASFNGVQQAIHRLQPDFMIASTLFSDAERDAYTQLLAKFDEVKKMKLETESLETRLQVFFDDIQDTDAYSMAEYRTTEMRAGILEGEFNARRGHLFEATLPSIESYIDLINSELPKKKPEPIAGVGSPIVGKHEYDEDEDDDGNSPQASQGPLKRRKSLGTTPVASAGTGAGGKKVVPGGAETKS